MLMPPHLRQAHEQSLARVTAGSAPRVLGTPNIQLEGQRQDGSQFPLELTINAVPMPGQHLFVGIMRDITVRKEMEEKLSRMAQFDALTGLPNRALFMDRLGTALARSKRSNAPFALMFLDLDGFKNINDTFGHHGGDALLVQVANRLGMVVRKSDTVARLAGDEFTVILEELADPVADANRLAKKIVETMRAPFNVDGQQAQVTASVGMVVHYPGEEEAEAADLLRRADEKMYAVKQAGKNDFSIA